MLSQANGDNDCQLIFDVKVVVATMQFIPHKTIRPVKHQKSEKK